MSFVKITELPLVNDSFTVQVPTLTSGDVMPIVHGPTTYKVELSTLNEYFQLGVTLSAAGDNGQVQVNDFDNLSAFKGFVYKKDLSGVQIGYDNILTGEYSSILGGSENTNSRTNTHVIGKKIIAAVDDFTLVNNLSAQYLLYAGNSASSNEWYQAFAYTNAQSGRLEQPQLDSRYVKLSGSTMTGNLSTLGSLSAAEYLYGKKLAIGTDTVPNFDIDYAEAGTIVGNLSVTGDIYGNLSAALGVIANTVFVSVSGDDDNDGLTMFTPFRTIKRAAAFVAKNQYGPFSNAANPGAPGLKDNKQYTIWVYAGNYEEENPIYLPPSTSLMSDNLRRASIYPKNPTFDILWQNNANYTWGFTFRNHVSPAAANAFPILSAGSGKAWTTRNNAMTAIAYRYGTISGKPNLYDITSPNTKPFIVTSPYIQGCSSITGDPDIGAPGGCGIRVDGSLVNGFLRSFVLDSFTQTNQGGIGIHIENNGYAQLVSTFTICCSAGVQTNTGGQCSINTSNASFGEFGLLAIGKSSAPVLTANTTSITQFNTNRVSISGAFETYNPSTYLTHNSWQIPISAPYDGLIFTISNDPVPNTLYSVGSAYVVNPDDAAYVLTTKTLTDNTIQSRGVVNFYLKSQITSSSHTFEYIGSGNVLSRALPSLGGVGNPDREAVALDGASVYFTSTNNFGDFKVGNGFTIVQENGTIEGRTFSRSILSLVTPLTLALE
jgi:hypothetical protein